MKIFGYDIKKAEKRDLTIGPSTGFGVPYGGSSPNVAAEVAMKLSAVYRCVDVVSDSIATMPFDIMVKRGNDWQKDFSHFSYPMLNVQPNPSLSKYTFMKALTGKILLNGNGYIWIHRDETGSPVWLQLLNGSVIMYLKPDFSVYYMFIDYYTHNETMIDGDDMIHILNFSYNGLLGVSTLTHAANTIGLAQASEGQAKGFFSNGANMTGILTVPGTLKPDKAKALKQALSDALQFNDITGIGGGIAIVEQGAEFKPLTINPKDAQMLETRTFNVIDICRFFGVNPTKAFDVTGGVSKSVESYQLGYITDTIAPFAKKIENEFNRKLYRPSQRARTKVILDINELMSSDLGTLAEYYSKLFPLGVFTTNEIRAKIHNAPVEEGDKPYVMVNLGKLGEPVQAVQNKNAGAGQPGNTL
jgi:HK97 family phage portal protein